MNHDKLAPTDVDSQYGHTEPIGTIVIEPGWRAEMTDRLDVVLSRRDGGAEGQAAMSTDDSADPIELELFNNRFAATYTFNLNDRRVICFLHHLYLPISLWSIYLTLHHYNLHT